MTEYNAHARDYLLKLLSLELGKDIDYDDFRMEYENTFNFSLDRTSVDEQDFEIFRRLFDKIVWYSPFPDERAKIPNYIGESEVDAAVAEARRALGLAGGVKNGSL